MTSEAGALAVRVRDANPADLTALAALSRKTFTDKFGQIYDPADLEQFLEDSHSETVYRKWLADPAIFIRVAEDDAGALAAYLLCSPLTLPAKEALPGAMELKRLYVDSSLQGRGLGSKFIEEAISWARKHGAPELYLSVFSGNDGAQRLYVRLGWEKVGEFFFPVGQHQDLEFLMRLKL